MDFGRTYFLFTTLGFLLLMGFPYEPLKAQKSKEYSLLIHSGEIPEDFLAEKEKNALMTYGTRKSQERFMVRNAYHLRQLMASGNVLFGDTVSAYINKVANIILKNDPILRKELRFYATRSRHINAFSAPNGIIFVNIGLIANLENEAQLAFILCHEISHYTSKHPQKKYLESQYKEKKHHSGERLLSEQHYTPALEFEADSLGLERYLNSPYASSEAATACKIIKEYTKTATVKPEFYTTISPFYPDTTKIGYEFLHSESRLNPEEIISRKRKNKLLRQINNRGKKGELCIIPDEAFDFIQKTCRYESCMYAIEDQSYETAIYSATFWQSYYQTSDLFLEKIKTFGWYGLAKYGNAGKIWEIHDDYQEHLSGYGSFCYVTEQLIGFPLHRLALKNAMYIHKIKPSDPLLTKVEEELWKETGKYYISSIDIEGEIIMKYGISFDSLLSPHESTLPLTQIRFLIMEGFNNKMLLSQKITDKRIEKKYQRRLLNKGFNLGIDTIVVIEPIYQRIEPEDLDNSFVISTAMQNGLVQRIEEYSARLNLKSFLLYSAQLRASQINYFRRLSLLNQWFREKNNTKDIGIITFRQEELQKILRHYGTPYFVWMGGVHLLKQPSAGGFSLQDVIELPLNPTSKYETLYYTIVYDLSKEEYLIIYPKYVKTTDRADVFHSIIYDMLFQIRKK